MDENVDVSTGIDEEEERKLLADTSEIEDEDNNELIEEESEDEENDKKAEAEIRSIQNTLIDDPYKYDAHKLLIQKLHKMGELDQLRLARENMSSNFPLTPELWLSWLRDEIKLAATKEQKNAIVELCERAVDDYLSVDVWLEYLQFSTGLGTEKETTERIRNLFERALTAAGLHVTKGALIWDVYREFENFILLMMDSTDPEQKNQLNRVGKLYRRQLSCPLIDMEKTFEEYKIWRSSEGYNYTEDEKIIKSGYEKALILLKEYIPFEKKLDSAQSDSEKLDIYKEYLAKEKELGDPGRVTVLYERAIAEICLEHTLWLDYLDYVNKHIKIDEILDKIYSKAVRNIPWCVKIWQNWIRSYEKNSKPIFDVQKLVEKALCVIDVYDYKNIWITYLEYLRRQIVDKSKDENKELEILRKTFNKASEHLEIYSLKVDPSCEVLQFWARTEAIHANNMDKARNLWTEIMAQGHSESAASWLEYITLERYYGDKNHLRKLFQKALKSVKDWPESIVNAWINFERDEGTLEEMEICEKITQERLEKVAEEREKPQKYVLHEESSHNKTNKRKIEEFINSNNSGTWSKVAKFKNFYETNAKEALNLEKNKKNLKNKKAKAKSSSHEETFKEKMKEESLQLQEVNDKVSVFISNLDYTASEEEIREALKSVGPIILLKLIKDFKNRSKGYGYVQLSNPEAVEAALKLDRVRINDRPMFISRCDPDRTSRGPNFKYKTELEKNKLFVKGLPTSITKEKLEEIFKIYGSLKEVRLVTYRNGRSKGLAYVEFENEQSAAKALVATDGMNVEDKTIIVAISQPPQRKKLLDAHYLQATKFLGGSSTSRSKFGNPKTILSMIPRTVIIKINQKDEKSSNSDVVQSMSNDDFRNMLLNNK